MAALPITKLLELIPPGSQVFVPGSAGEPVAMTRALQDDPSLAIGSSFYCSFIPGVNRTDLGVANARQMTVFFMQNTYRQGIQDGSAHYLPMTYSAIQQHLSHPGQIDTALLQVSPPNGEGRCSLGPHGEFLPALLSSKRRLLAVINPRVPHYPGAPSVALKDLAGYCEDDSPLREFSAGETSKEAELIAKHIAELIPDGATLQCGLGKVPNQLMAALDQHRNLRLHSGMVSDGLLGLHEAGALAPDSAIVATAALGSTDFYKRALALPELQIRGVDYTHRASTLAATAPLIAVNSALEIDLLGQVNADTLKGKPVSGPGGLPDFAAGARAQEHGLSVIALPSTDPSGKHSRIVAGFTPGTAVTVPHYNVDAVVTEQGVAWLRGLSPEARAQCLLTVAHPDHHDAIAATYRHGL